MPAASDIHLRPYALDDATAIVDAVRESLAAGPQPWLPWAHDYTLEEASAWLDLKVAAFERRAAFEFAIVAGDGRYLGGCGLNRVDPVHRRANLGYWVQSCARGRGVATTAVRLLRDWGFTETDLVRLEIIVPVSHAASLRVAEKSGAVREGTLRHRLVIGGMSHDAAVFSFIRDVDAPGARARA